MGMRRLYQFDERGDQVRMVFDTYWTRENNMIDSMVYDTAHHLTDRYSRSNDPTDYWKFVHKHYTYDRAGHKTSMIFDSMEDGQWKSTGRDEFEYDSAGNRICYKHNWNEVTDDPRVDIISTHYEPVK